jgi:hypothetical protein
MQKRKEKKKVECGLKATYGSLRSLLPQKILEESREI